MHLTFDLSQLYAISIGVCAGYKKQSKIQGLPTLPESTTLTLTVRLTLCITIYSPHAYLVLLTHFTLTMLTTLFHCTSTGILLYSVTVCQQMALTMQFVCLLVVCTNYRVHADCYVCYPGGQTCMSPREGTPILGHGRELLWWWPHFWSNWVLILCTISQGCFSSGRNRFLPGWWKKLDKIGFCPVSSNFFRTKLEESGRNWILIHGIYLMLDKTSANCRSMILGKWTRGLHLDNK